MSAGNSSVVTLQRTGQDYTEGTTIGTGHDTTMPIIGVALEYLLDTTEVEMKNDHRIKVGVNTTEAIKTPTNQKILTHLLMDMDNPVADTSHLG